MLQITPTFSILKKELTIDFICASGPGGQNVNKVATTAQLRFDVRNSPSLTEEVRARLVTLAGSKMTKSGVLVIVAKRYQAREQNRSDAEHRLATLIRKALLRPKSRRPTHPTAVSQARRIESKKFKGNTKRLRHSNDE